MSSKVQKDREVLVRRKAVVDDLAKRNNGIADAEQLVNEANAPTHPLHDEFVWDDSIAGHRYRIEQATKIIRSVHWEVRTVEFPKVPPLFVHRQGKGSRRQYISLAALKNKEDEARETMKVEFERAINAVSRARMIADVLDLGEMLAEFEATVKAMFAKIKPVLAASRKRASRHPVARKAVRRKPTGKRKHA